MVDPGAEVARILVAVARHQLTVKQIVVTHAHIDHIAGALQLRQLTGAPIVYNQYDLPLVAIMDEQAGWLDTETPEVPPPDIDAADGATVSIEGLAASLIHTPGHTPGSVCLYFPGQRLLLAGDTLFAGSIGRTDLPGGDERRLLHSIQTKLMALPDETVVIPGHGEPTTIGRERQTNPFL